MDSDMQLTAWNIAFAQRPDMFGSAPSQPAREAAGFVEHFFDHSRVRQLAAGFDMLDVHEFEEGPLPRRLLRVTLLKSTV